MIRTHGPELRCLRSYASSAVRVCVLAVGLCFAAAQDTSPVSPCTNQNDTRYTIRADVNQVLVRVVVRDSRGKAVSGLKREDFTVLDNGKPQIIISFSESRRDGAETSTRGTSRTTDQIESPSTPLAQSTRFTTYLFDDMHMKPEELSAARSAADVQSQHLNLQSSERVAIFSTAGTVRQAFTNDPSNIRSALSLLKANEHKGFKYEITARKGYYEPGKRAAAEQQSANQALAEFFFSQEQRRDIPVDVTVYFGRSTGDGHLVLGKPNSDGTFATFVDARIGIQSLRYRREKDRLVNVLTELCGVFDQNGNFLTASQNTTNLRLTRAQISNLKSGVSVRSSFRLKPGFYVMRLVLQDRQGKMISARSVAVEIK